MSALLLALLLAADDNGLTATAEATASVQIVDAVQSGADDTLRGSTAQVIVTDGCTMTVTE